MVGATGTSDAHSLDRSGEWVAPGARSFPPRRKLRPSSSWAVRLGGLIVFQGAQGSGSWAPCGGGPRRLQTGSFWRNDVKIRLPDWPRFVFGNLAWGSMPTHRMWVGLGPSSWIAHESCLILVWRTSSAVNEAMIARVRKRCLPHPPYLPPGRAVPLILSCCRKPQNVSRVCPPPCVTESAVSRPSMLRTDTVSGCAIARVRCLSSPRVLPRAMVTRPSL